MFARVSVYEIEDGRIDDAVESFTTALGKIRSLDGFSEGFFFVTGEDDQATALTLWTSRRALEASRTAASKVRTEAARAVGGAVISAREYEVAVHVRGGQES